jgi:uncharacterized protein YgiM (DUF1202 family)
MAARRFSFLPAFLIAAAALAALPASLPAQESGSEAPAPAPEVPNAKFNVFGEVTGNNVYVRSGPSDSYYPTTKLNKGSRVKVVGEKFNYLKIEPPPGSFSYVGKAYVERRGDGGIGRVTTAANVRTGSDLNSMKTTVQTKLETGTDVKILGEQEEYYKIEPPPGAYLYVGKDFVLPKERIPDQGIASAEGQEQGRPQPTEATEQQTETAPDPSGAGGAIADIATGEGSEAEQPAGQDPLAVAPTTDKAPAATETAEGQPATPARTERAATRPTDSQPVSAEARFEQLQGEFEAASQQPVIGQPIDDLLTRYQTLVQDEALPESLKRIADARINALKVRKQTRDEFAAVRKTQDEMDTRRKALQAERQELEEQIRATQVEFFAAVGTLRPSSLQNGPRGTTLYRLTDPESGRTLVYIRSKDPQITALLNQFVGVKGEMVPDPLLRMRVITPSEAKSVDQTKVGSTIAAGVIPASILRNTPTVTTDSAPIEGQ